MDFDYFYNREAERFNFLKVPEILVDGEEFKGLSAEAIILYSMLLKRTGMSFKNNWIDKEGRVFIYFTVEEIMKRRNISKPTAIKTLDELDSKKGIGLIERVRFGFGKPNIIYVKDGHAYCKVCHERKDGKVMDFLGSKMIFRISCKCDRDREIEQKKREKQLEIERLKSSCFTSIIQWSYIFENYQGEENQSLIIAKNFVKNYEDMKKENIGLLFYGSVGSGKTYLACSIANALIEKYQISVKIRNFAQIINELQKGGFDFDKNAYIESLVNTSVLILDDLGIERDTSYAKEQVYNIVNNRYLKHKPTIFTTNLSYETIQNCTESVEYQRIYSRIIEMCIPIMVVGDDFRKKIQRDKLKRNKVSLSVKSLCMREMSKEQNMRFSE